MINTFYKYTLLKNSKKDITKLVCIAKLIPTSFFCNVNKSQIKQLFYNVGKRIYNISFLLNYDMVGNWIITKQSWYLNKLQLKSGYIVRVKQDFINYATFSKFYYNLILKINNYD